MIPIIQLITGKKFSQAMKALAATPSLLASTLLDDPAGEGVTHYAARSGNVDFMKYLIGLGADIDRAVPDSLHLTPLCAAAEVGDREMIDLLCKNRARVDGADASAFSPLMIAAKSAMPDCVELLLENGADPNRLGFVQRYLPFDFAGWQDSEACRTLIRAANGRSVADDFDWRSQPGYPIIVTVSNQIGAVFPIQLSSAMEKVSIRVAQVRSKPKCMYVFTDELHACGKTELAFYLESTWGILCDYKDGSSEQSFPIDVLRKLGGLIELGSLKIKEGDVFERSETLLDQLAWPDGVVALIAVDHTDGQLKDASVMSKGSDDTVVILILVPLLKDGAWSKGPKQLTKALETIKRARLPKVMLADPLQI